VMNDTSCVHDNNNGMNVVVNLNSV
jgi:hypothetical protein